jgi:hypothetical protein
MSFSFSQSFTKIRTNGLCEFYICSCFDNATDDEENEEIECRLRMPTLKELFEG